MASLPLKSVETKHDAEVSGIVTLEPARAWEAEVTATIRQIGRDVETLDLKSFEAAEPSVEMARIVVRVDELAARATQLMKLVLSQYEAPADPVLEEEPSFGPDETTAVRSMEAGSIAFVAQLELRQCRERLAVSAGLNLLTVLSECDRTLRRILRGLIALDEVLSVERGLPRVLDQGELLSRSLRVRACYAELNAKINSIPPPEAATITRALRLVGTSLAVLVGRETYPELRVGDRLQLRALQYRILSWLRGGPAPVAALEGLQLWSDIVSFIAILRQVNRRPELIEHDTRVLELAKRTLDDGPPQTHWPSAVFDALCRLRGKDSAIDALLAAPEPTLVEPWRALLDEAR